MNQTKHYQTILFDSVIILHLSAQDNWFTEKRAVHGILFASELVNIIVLPAFIMSKTLIKNKGNEWRLTLSIISLVIKWNYTSNSYLFFQFELLETLAINYHYQRNCSHRGCTLLEQSLRAFLQITMKVFTFR